MSDNDETVRSNFVTPRQNQGFDRAVPVEDEETVPAETAQAYTPPPPPPPSILATDMSEQDDPLDA